jgi:hypothetical protein
MAHNHQGATFSPTTTPILLKSTIYSPAGRSSSTSIKHTTPYYHLLPLTATPYHPPMDICTPNWETSPHISTTTTPGLVKPTMQTLTNGSYPTSIRLGTPYHKSLLEKTLHPCPKYPFLSPPTDFATENQTATSIIYRISTFQLHTIHQQTLLQQFPNACVAAPSSHISRSKNSAPDSPNANFILPLLSPLPPRVRTPWNMESRPVFHVESPCQLHLSIAPLAVALQAKSQLVLAYPDFFSPPPTTTSHYSQNNLEHGI